MLIFLVVVGVRGSSCNKTFTMEPLETLGDEVAQKLMLLELTMAELEAGDNSSYAIEGERLCETFRHSLLLIAVI